MVRTLPAVTATVRPWSVKVRVMATQALETRASALGRGRRRSRAASSMAPAASTRPPAAALARLGRCSSARGGFANSARGFVAWTDAQVFNRFGRPLDAGRRLLIAVREGEGAGAAHRQLLDAAQPGDEARRAGRAAEAARLERVGQRVDGDHAAARGPDEVPQDADDLVVRRRVLLPRGRALVVSARRRKGGGGRMRRRAIAPAAAAATPPASAASSRGRARLALHRFLLARSGARQPAV